VKRTSVIAVMTAAVAATIVVAGPASASENCPSDSICLYYNSVEYGLGSYEHWSPGAGYELSNFRFTNWGNNGSGYNVVVAGHAAAITNNTGDSLWISDGSGSEWTVPAWYSGDLANISSTLKNNEYYFGSN
jgi:hypothetical protein